MPAGVARADVLDQHVQVLQRRLVQALRQAGVRERAGRAEGELVAVVGDDVAVDPGERGAAHGWSHSRAGKRRPVPGLRWRGRTWARRLRWAWSGDRKSTRLNSSH